MTTGLMRCLIVLISVTSLSLGGCASAPRQTVELAEVTEQQAAALQKSHVQLVQSYYARLRADVNAFIDTRWTPVFLSKAVQNADFRKDLDQAYVISSISPSDVQITWQGRPLREPQKSAILSGVKDVITKQRGRLGSVLLNFSEAAQEQINKKRLELLKPIDQQERMVIANINAAYADLQRAQSTVKAYLAAAVNLKENQDLLLEKMGALEQRDKLMNKALDANDKLSAILDAGDDAKQAVKDFLDKAKEINRAIEAEGSTTATGASTGTT